jgi:extracellular factor (EF) 3-hydroxypalmitic acid methyl ester biosynthesis protein
MERAVHLAPAELRAHQEWFRSETDSWWARSPMMRRARSWPEGYPGDYLTLERVYANAPAGDELGQILDRFFLTRTLAVAVRSRCRHLSELLRARAEEEGGEGNWLNLACGSCRELLAVQGARGNRRVVCVDMDKNALQYAERQLANRPPGEVRCLAENAYRFMNARRNIERFGSFTTVYSAGLFDYLPDDRLAPLLRGLYDSLAPGGLFIAPFKDMHRYETFDYHWVVAWHQFYQRNEAGLRAVFRVAGIPTEEITVSRDPSGVLLFFTIRRGAPNQ